MLTGRQKKACNTCYEGQLRGKKVGCLTKDQQLVNINSVHTQPFLQLPFAVAEEAAILAFTFLELLKNFRETVDNYRTVLRPYLVVKFKIPKLSYRKEILHT